MYDSCFRLYKSPSPSRTWLMGSSRNRKGLPPQPKGVSARRGSATPTPGSPYRDRAPLPPVPNRSRSLDGLLDEVPNSATLNKIHKNSVDGDNDEKLCVTRSCDSIDLDSPAGSRQNGCDDCEEETPISVKNKSTRSIEDNLDDSGSSCGDPKRSSQASLSSDSKRKRNFMDRCVNKVRSLIRKWSSESLMWLSAAANYAIFYRDIVMWHIVFNVDAVNELNMMMSILYFNRFAR